MKWSHGVLGLLAIGVVGAGLNFFEVFKERPVLKLKEIPEQPPPTAEEFAVKRDNAAKLVLERRASVGLLLKKNLKACASNYDKGTFALSPEVLREMEAPLFSLGYAARSARFVFMADKTSFDPLTENNWIKFFRSWGEAGATRAERDAIIDNDTASPVYCSARVKVLLYMREMDGPEGERMRHQYVAKLLGNTNWIIPAP